MSDGENLAGDYEDGIGHPFMFEADWLDVLDAAVDAGFFRGGRPEDYVVRALYRQEARPPQTGDDADDEEDDDEDSNVPELTEEQDYLLDTRILPLLRLYYFEHGQFAGEYAKRREPGWYEQAEAEGTLPHFRAKPDEK